MSKRNYPKPTPIQRVKHILYWIFLAITFIPFVVCYGAGKVSEFMDEFLGAVRRWCFSERYVSKSQLPPRRK